MNNNIITIIKKFSTANYRNKRKMSYDMPRTVGNKCIDVHKGYQYAKYPFQIHKENN